MLAGGTGSSAALTRVGVAQKTTFLPQEDLLRHSVPPIALSGAGHSGLTPLWDSLLPSTWPL